MSYRQASAIISTTGIARPTRYLVSFSGPGELIPPSATARLTVACENVSFPGRTFQTNESRIYGPAYRTPYVPTYPLEITMTFRVGADFYEKRVFEQWMDKINNPDTFDMAYPDEYQFNVFVAAIQDHPGALGRIAQDIATNFGFGGRSPETPITEIGNENIVYQAELFRCFPTAINDIELSHGAVDQYMQVQVTFSYQKYRNLPVLQDSDISATALNTASGSSDALNAPPQTRGVFGQVVDIAQRGSGVAGLFNRGSAQLLSF
jgi:hypothetical protein